MSIKRQFAQLLCTFTVIDKTAQGHFVFNWWRVRLNILFYWVVVVQSAITKCCLFDNLQQYYNNNFRRLPVITVNNVQIKLKQLITYTQVFVRSVSPISQSVVLLYNFYKYLQLLLCNFLKIILEFLAGLETV